MKDITSTFTFTNNFEKLTEEELFKTIGGKKKVLLTIMLKILQLAILKVFLTFGNEYKNSLKE